MKRFLIALTALTSVICVAFGFSACGNDSPEDRHETHNFDKKVIQQQYLKSAATCQHAAVYYFSCECGEKGEETFEYGRLGQHDYVNGICKYCGEINIEGLDFNLNEDNSGYVVTSVNDNCVEVIIPDKYKGLPVTQIGDYAFENCSNLTRVTIPDSVTVICQYSFSGCSSLTGITIPDGVTSIGSYAFDGCSSLTGTTIPDSVTSLGYQTFRGCDNLIQIENGVSYVDKWVIACDVSVTNVSLRNGTKKIAGDAFNFCTSLTAITIPDGVTSIGDGAFTGCVSLSEITIPDSVTTVCGYVFTDCYSLIGITIGNGVTSIGDYVFDGCSSLTSINYNGTKEQWEAIEKGLYWNEGTGNYTVHCTNGNLTKN